MFTFEIDELEIEITKGVFTTIGASLRVEATQDSYGDIFIEMVEADCGAYSTADKKFVSKWVRVDDELNIRVKLLSLRKDIGRARNEAFVNDENVLNGEILFTIGDAL